VRKEDLVYHIYVMSINHMLASFAQQRHTISHRVVTSPGNHISSHPHTPYPQQLPIEIERIPAQRTSASIARLEPLEQTAGVVHVLARRAALLRQLAVAADDAVADGALRLALESTHDVAAERRHAVGDGTVLLRKSVSGDVRFL